jgi:hypothetical protein
MREQVISNHPNSLDPGASMTVGSKTLRLVAAGLASLAMLGCGKPDNPNDYPLSHWLDDGDDTIAPGAFAGQDFLDGGGVANADTYNVRATT